MSLLGWVLLAVAGASLFFALFIFGAFVLLGRALLRRLAERKGWR